MYVNTKKVINLKKYPALQFHKEVAAFSYSFLEKFNYCIFNFIRLYSNGNAFYLCDNYEWLNYYLSHGYPAIGAFEQNTSLRSNEFVLWSALDDKDPIVVYSRELFNIKYGITLIRKFKEGFDFFNFGTANNSLSAFNIITSQLNDLNKFIDTFYDRSKSLILTMEKTPLNLKELKCEPLSSDVKKIYLGPMYNYSHLTEKEVSYLKNLTDGMTIPEIANLWNISPRTIEKHLENIKHKLGCRTQCELGYMVAKLGILKI